LQLVVRSSWLGWGVRRRVLVAEAGGSRISAGWVVVEAVWMLKVMCFRCFRLLVIYRILRIDK